MHLLLYICAPFALLVHMSAFVKTPMLEVDREDGYGWYLRISYVVRPCITYHVIAQQVVVQRCDIFAARKHPAILFVGGMSVML